MSYDPTERMQWPPDQQPPAYGQQPPDQQPPAYGQSNPGLPPYGQQPPAQQQPAYGQQPPNQQQPPSYGQSNPGLPPYGQQPVPPTQVAPSYGQSNPNQPPYSQQPVPPTPVAPSYGQSNPNQPLYGQQTPPQTAYGQPPMQAAPAYDPAMPGYGQSGPTYPPVYGQQNPPMSDPYAPTPSGQYLPQQPDFNAYGNAGQNWAGGNAPGGLYPGQAPPQPKKGNGLRILIIALVVLLLLGGAGVGSYAYYLSTRPKPVITSLTSNYSVRSIPAGANTTTFTLIAEDFTSNSAITFLLDGSQVPGSQSVTSDSKGNVNTTLTVTSAWAVGSHTITAEDAANYKTALGKTITVVNPGEASTPGPNGAPPDDANGTIVASITANNNTANYILNVKNGTVCRTQDDGQSHSSTGTLTDGTGYRENRSMTCSGTYKTGKLAYTETVTSDTITFDDGVTCTASSSYVNAQLDGTFTSNTAVSGNYSDGAANFVCSGQGTSTNSPVNAETGSFTGVASMTAPTTPQQ